MKRSRGILVTGLVLQIVGMFITYMGLLQSTDPVPTVNSGQDVAREVFGTLGALVTLAGFITTVIGISRLATIVDMLGAQLVRPEAWLPQDAQTWKVPPSSTQPVLTTGVSLPPPIAVGEQKPPPPVEETSSGAQKLPEQRGGSAADAGVVERNISGKVLLVGDEPQPVSRG